MEDGEGGAAGIMEVTVLEGGGDGGQLDLVVDAVLVVEPVGGGMGGGVGDIPGGAVCGVAFVVEGVDGGEGAGVGL